MAVKAGTTRRKLDPHDILKSAASQQASRFTDKDIQTKKVIRPAYDPEEWSALLGYSTRYKKCVDLMAQNTVGLGYEVVIDEKALKGMKADEKAGVEEAKAALEKVLASPNPNYDFTTLVADLLKKDEESTGDCYVEVMRADEPDEDGNKPIVGFAHLPSKTTRILENGNFLSRKYRADRFFPPFGSERVIDVKTGKTLTITNDEALAKFQANEVIHLRLFSPMDEIYGVPRAATALASIVGQHKVDIRNVTFFDYDALARLIIVMKGGTPDDYKALKQECKSFIDQSRGNNESSRILHMQASSTRSDEKPDVDIQEIGKYNQDATFLEYRKECQEDVREAFGIAKILLGTASDVNRASALATLKSTIDNVFRPETRRWSYVWTNQVAHDFHPALTLRFHEADASDAELQAELLKVYGEVGHRSVNEIRELDGLERIEDEEQADKPLALLRLTVSDLEKQTAASNALKALQGHVSKITAAKDGG